MLSVYPFASGSLYTASYAVTSSFAHNVRFIQYTISSSVADMILYPESGSPGKSVCLLTTEQYLIMSSTGRVENCNFS